MHGLLSTLLPYVLLYKYIAIFIITFLGALALPIPSGSILMAASFFSIQGFLNFSLVITVGIIGNMAGDSAGYWIARKYGTTYLANFSVFRNMFNSKKFEYVGRQINNHPIITIYLSRFMTSIAPAVNIIAGLYSMDYKRFLLFEGLGEVSEVLIYCFIGHALGSHWEDFEKLGGYFWVITVTGIILTYFFWQWITKKSKKNKLPNNSDNSFF